MKLKELESCLQGVADFVKPKQNLEQYITGPHLASQVLHAIAEDFEDLEDSVLLDLGCGTGMLSIGAAVLGTPHVLGVDVDSDALQQALANVGRFEDLPVDLVCCDVADVAAGALMQRVADVVIANPPFGSWQKGSDVLFLRAAFRATRRTVYTLHKRSTRAHINRVATQQLGATAAEVIATLEYDLPATYKHHRQASKDIEVDLWRFEVGSEDLHEPQPSAEPH